MTRFTSVSVATMGALCGLAVPALATDGKKLWECAAAWRSQTGEESYHGRGTSRDEAIEATIMMCVRLNRGRSSFCRDNAELIICRKEGEFPERVRPR